MRDLKFAMRQLLKHPGFTAVGIPAALLRLIRRFFARLFGHG